VDRPAPPDWVIEGFRQIRLAVALERCAVESEAGYKQRAVQLRELNSRTALRFEWLPGAKAVAMELAKRKTLSAKFWDEAIACYTSHSPDLASEPADAAKILHRSVLFLESKAKFAGNGTEWPLWIDAKRVWLSLGFVLISWLELLPKLHGATDRVETVSGLASTFDRSLKDNAVIPSGMKELHSAAKETLDWELGTTETSAAGLSRGIREVREFFSTAPADWPPFALRDGIRGLRDWEKTKPEFEFPRIDEAYSVGLTAEVVTRIRLALGFVDYVDRTATGGRVPTGTWDLLDSTIQRLLQPCKLSGEIQREFGSPKTERVETAGLVVPRLDRTGLRITRPDGSVAFERTARVLIPPPQSRLMAAVQNLIESDATLGELANQLAFPESDDWSSLTTDDRATWWQLVVNAANRSTPTSLEFLQRIGARGIELVPMPHAGAVSGPWFVVPSSTREPRAGPKFAVRFPDGIEFGPAIAVQLGPPSRPLVRCLANCEPSLGKLRQHDPAWPGWNAYNDAVWALAYRNGDSEENDPEAGLAAFEAVYQRSYERDVLAEYYRDLARRLYRCVSEELQVAVVPTLDPQTLEATPIRSIPADDTEIEWTAEGSVPGSVLQVLQFRRSSRPARLRVGLGAGAAALCDWLNLPAPPAGPLADWWQSARALFADRTRYAEAARDHQQAISIWLETPAGSAWFSQSGLDHPWVRQLVKSHWCSLYPPIDAQTKRHYWPEDAPHDLELVKWEFSEEVAFRGLIRDVVIAPVASQAGGVFSLGSWNDAKQYFVAADDLRTLVPGTPLLDRVWSTSVASRFEGVEGRRVVKLAVELAAWLGTAPPGAEPLVRDWCAEFGYDLLSSAFSLEPPVPRFHPTHELGTAWVVQYGLGTPEGVIVKPVDAVSAGPAPKHFPELEAEVTALGVQDLTEDLASWPAAAVGGYLEGVLANFYVQLWYRCEIDPHPRKYAAAKESLLRVIHDNYGWTQFEPARLSDFDESWIEFDRSRPGRSGQIQKLLRAGLRDGEHCKVAAKVIAD